jgi:hypothetical protein
MKLIHTESSSRAKTASEYMFKHRNKYSYGFNNLHGTIAEEEVSENYNINWTNPNPTAPIDFPADKLRHSSLPEFVRKHRGHGLEWKSVNRKKVANIKLGDAGINATMLESGGYVLGCAIFDDEPCNVESIKFWVLEAQDNDMLAIHYSKVIRSFMNDKSNSVDDIRARVREINVILRNGRSRFSLTDCSSSDGRRRCVQLVLKTNPTLFDWDSPRRRKGLRPPQPMRESIYKKLEKGVTI